jgi:hypothetical protein
MYTVPGPPITAEKNPADSHAVGNTGPEKSAPGIVLIDVRRVQVAGDSGKLVNFRIADLELVGSPAAHFVFFPSISKFACRRINRIATGRSNAIQ